MKIATLKAEIQDQQIALSANFKNLTEKAELTGETVPQSEIDAYKAAMAELQAKYDALWNRRDKSQQSGPVTEEKWGIIEKITNYLR